jgi:dynein heavy chain 1
VLLMTQASDMLSKLLKVQLLDDDDELAYAGEGAADSEDVAERRASVDGRPSWMHQLLSSANSWISLLPDSLTTLYRTGENIKDPLYRCFEREVNMCSNLLKLVKQDIRDVQLICKGEKKQTNHHRNLLSQLSRGVIPKWWKDSYIVPPGTTVIQWMTDFAERSRQMQRVTQATTSGGPEELKILDVNLGLMFNPEAYITATRQSVAQANKWSLEELKLQVTINENENAPLPTDPCSFAIRGLKLQGAECNNNELRFSNAILVDLPLTVITWTREVSISAGKIMLPVYLNSTRSDLLFTVDLEKEAGQLSRSFYERGVALIASSALG